MNETSRKHIFIKWGSSYEIVQQSTATVKKNDCNSFTERQILAGLLLFRQANLHGPIWQNSQEEIADKN